MKNIISSLLIAFLFIGVAKGQDNCSTYYPLEEGATFSYTNYNKKGKEEGKTSYEIVTVNTDGSQTNATMKVNLKDEKGKEIFTSEYGLTCNEQSINIDFESLISKQMTEQFKDLEMEITGTDVEIPNNLGVGQELADANVAIKINMGAMNMNMTVETINRKVEKKESVTTSAGTFDCIVIYSENKTKMMMANKVFPNRIWLAEDIGMVKQESYNAKGKLMSSSVLTSFSK